VVQTSTEVAGAGQFCVSKIKTDKETDMTISIISHASSADVWQKLQTTNENGETESSFRMSIKQVKTERA